MYALPNKTQHKLIVKVRGGISQSPAIAAVQNTSISSPLSSVSPASSSTPSSSRTSSLIRDAAHKFGQLAGPDCENRLPQPIFHSLNQNGGKNKPLPHHNKGSKHFITPEHNEMIKYVQQSWKGVERDYKKSVNGVINNLNIESSSDQASMSRNKNANAKKKTATASAPLLLSGSYHNTSTTSTNDTASRQDSFRPFDLEAFWGNRILKRLTEDVL